MFCLSRFIEFCSTDSRVGLCTKSVFTCSVRWMVQNMKMLFTLKFIMELAFLVCTIGVSIHLTELQCTKTCQMTQDGRTRCDVATELGVSQSSIWNIRRWFQEIKNHHRQRVSCQPRATNAVDDQYLTISVHWNPFQSVRRIQNEFR